MFRKIISDDFILRHPVHSYFAILFSADTKEIFNLTKEIGTEWIALSWESPCNVTTKTSVIYSIERCDDKICIQENETNTYHNAINLEPCTQYAFKVKILTEFWESDGVNVSATTASECSIGLAC